jgi:signal transduction histidine kinase
MERQRRTEQLYGDLQAAHADLKAAQEARDALAHMIVHDMRTPLTTFRICAASLGRKNPGDGRAFELIIAQTDLLARLLGDLLEASSLEAGRVRLRRSRVELVELARTAAREARAVSPAHPIRLEATEAQVVGWWDGDRLRQIL